jgi:tripartite-type tricarboxylate transporter receptor subunit TctC
MKFFFTALKDNPPRLSSRRDAMASMLSTALFAAGMQPGSASAANEYPNKPIKLIVDSTPGGLTDLLARIAADRTTRSLGVPFVVDNKAGATGRLAEDSLVRSPADGYTLLFCSNGSLFSKPFLDKGAALNPAADIQGVFGAGDAPHLLVVPASLPVKDMAEFIAYAKAHPRPIFYGSAGVGSLPHISMSQLIHVARIQAEHVPYKGMGAAVSDLLGGQLQAVVAGLGTVRPYLKGGQLKALAVAATKRLPSLPDVPTSAEAGVAGWQMSTWFGVFAPKRTSPDVLRRLNSAFAAAVEDPAVKQKLLEMGVEPMDGSIQSFAERVRVDYAAYAKVIKDSKVKLE